MNTKTTESSVNYITETNRRAIIFFNEDIEDDIPAMQKDSKKLKKVLLEELHFQAADSYRNLTKEDLFQKLEECA